MTLNLFVYGTLRFGDVRWRFLEPYVVDEGEPDSAAGTLYDTGAGYPAVLFGTDDVVLGHRYSLLPDRRDDALATLDEVESAVTGLYHRIEITTASGHQAWAYQYGLDTEDASLALNPIPSGDWFQRSST